MGIDYSGGMIVGALGSEIIARADYNEDLWEWAEANDIENMSPHYDSDISYRYFGFFVDDVDVKDMGGLWFSDVKEKAKKFKELTGLDAQLIGSQDIY